MGNYFTDSFWHEFNEVLLYWFEGNRRILPWREDPSPYHVWVSEIMLQQTRVEAVKPYYDRFLSALPDVRSLAEADERVLLKLWEGLGYYSRVRNMQAAAKKIVTDYQGQIPGQYEFLIELKGIGSYTAGAISSIAFGNPVPAVDGNVLRVMSRNLEYGEDILKDSTKKYFFQLLKEHMPKDRPGEFNQALMELGAMVCIPNGKPLCEDCPLYGTCLARKRGTIDKYPVRGAKKARTLVHRVVFLIFDENGRIMIRKRPPAGLLAGMWELPGADMEFPRGEEGYRFLEDLFGTEKQPESIGTGKHIFSHIEWNMTCVTVKNITWEDSLKDRMEQLTGKSEETVFATPEEIREKYPLPAAFSMWL